MKRITHKKLTSLILAGLFSISVSGAAGAAEQLPINLEDSVQMALANNRTIKQSVADRDNAFWGLREARRSSGLNLKWETTLNRIGGGSYDTYRKAYYTGQSDAAYKNAFGNTVTLTYPLYTGGKLEHSIEAAEYGLNAADLTLENTLQSVRQQATAYYYSMLQYRNMIDVRNESMKTLQEHLENVSAQYRVGIVAKSDVLRSEVELANARQALVSAENNYDIAVATLNNYIGLPANTILLPQEQLTYTKYDLSLDGCTAYALKNRPDGAAADYAVKQAELAKEIAKSNYRPQVSAQAAAARAGENAFGKDHSDSWQAGLVANWNIFDNGVTSAQVHESETAFYQAQEQAAATKEGIELDVRNAYLNLLAAEKNISTTQIAVSLAEEDYKIASVRYSAGVDTNLAVMDAESSLTTARMNYYQALYEYNTSKAALDKAMGVPVGIDATRYVAAVEEGKSAAASREEAALTAEDAKRPVAVPAAAPVLSDYSEASVPVPSESIMSDVPLPNQSAQVEAPAAKDASPAAEADTADEVSEMTADTPEMMAQEMAE